MSRALCVFVSKQTLERVGSFLLPFSLCSVGWIQINQRKWQNDKIKHRKHVTHVWFLTTPYISSNAFIIFGLQVIKLEGWDSQGLIFSVMQVSQVGWVFGKAVWRQKQIVKPTQDEVCRNAGQLGWLWGPIGKTNTGLLVNTNILHY